MKKIQIINGPNLNLLGRREPGVYGARPFDDCLAGLRRRYPGVQIDYFQSNIEGELINRIHEVGFDYDGIILNAGAYTHTSIALQDAIRAVPAPVVEVHISNVHARVDDCRGLPWRCLRLRAGFVPPGPGGAARRGLSVDVPAAEAVRYRHPAG